MIEEKMIAYRDADATLAGLLVANSQALDNIGTVWALEIRE
jgi:hypothetical protein